MRPATLAGFDELYMRSEQKKDEESSLSFWFSSSWASFEAQKLLYSEHIFQTGMDADGAVAMEAAAQATIGDKDDRRSLISIPYDSHAHCTVR